MNEVITILLFNGIKKTFQGKKEEVITTGSDELQHASHRCCISCTVSYLMQSRKLMATTENAYGKEVVPTAHNSNSKQNNIYLATLELF